MPQLTPAQYVAKRKPAELWECAANQAPFIELCRLLNQPTPAEYGAAGDRGFADVGWKGNVARGQEWKRECREPNGDRSQLD